MRACMREVVLSRQHQTHRNIYFLPRNMKPWGSRTRRWDCICSRVCRTAFLYQELAGSGCIWSRLGAREGIADVGHGGGGKDIDRKSAVARPTLGGQDWSG
jgi:hypothetical protein